MRKVLAAIAAVLVLSGCVKEESTFLQDQWDSLNSDNQRLFCLMWEFDKDPLVRDLIGLVPAEENLTKRDVIRFFNAECR